MDITGVGLDIRGRQGFVRKSREGFGHWRGKGLDIVGEEGLDIRERERLDIGGGKGFGHRRGKGWTSGRGVRHKGREGFAR